MRGRKPIQIDKKEFQNIINELETANKFVNRTQLWEAVENTEWAKNIKPRPLTKQVAMLRATEFDLIISTPKGSRGKLKGSGPVSRGNRKSRKMSEDAKKSLIEGIPLEMRQTLSKTVERAASGSMKAAVKLKCLDCTNWQKKEVALCTSIQCPLYSFRPYKRDKTSSIMELEMVQ